MGTELPTPEGAVLHARLNIANDVVSQVIINRGDSIVTDAQDVDSGISTWQKKSQYCAAKVMRCW
jgi:hypothetical protein